MSDFPKVILTTRGPALWGGKGTDNLDCLPVGTIVVDREGDAWSRKADGWWWAGDRINPFPRDELPLGDGAAMWSFDVPNGTRRRRPMSDTPWEKFMSGNGEVIPIRLIDFDADLIAAYLAPACRH